MLAPSVSAAETRAIESKGSSLIWNIDVLTANKRNMHKDKSVSEAINTIREEADKALRLPPLTVTNKKQLPASGDPHDYFSVGPYWWPDNSKPDGLPWVRQDGQVNPTFRYNQADNVLFKTLVQRIQALAYSYFYTDRTQYAAQAIKLLRVWFIDAETRMNPNLNYAQSIPGRTDGRGIGIIDFRSLVYLLDVLPLLQAQMTEVEQQALQQWLQDFLDWLKHSANGQDEAAMHNNHGSFYDLIVTSVAWYLDDHQLIKETASHTRQRILAQIQSDGKQPHELVRTRPFHYSTFNLKALFGVARVASRIGVDLWQTSDREQTAASARMLIAYQYLIDNIDNSRQWQGSQEAKPALKEMVSLAYQAKLIYQDNRFFELLGNMPEDVLQQVQQCRLVFTAAYTPMASQQTANPFCDY
ncbi:alginate lyase family protein [Neptunicella sp. SCSIO 80796]|uniref:alginate lyase family protein n=1 Tax=Neptunicella plasticusilytica TaxID=3117012 RepID=UPI003A4DBD48